MIQRVSVADDLIRYDLFRAMVGDGQKADLIDGVCLQELLATPPPKKRRTRRR